MDTCKDCHEAPENCRCTDRVHPLSPASPCSPFRDALEALLKAAPTAADLRLLLVLGNATPAEKPELFAQADALEKARKDAVELLNSANVELKNAAPTASDCNGGAQ